MSHVQKLSPEEVWFFSHNGFIKLPNVLPAEHVEKLRETVTYNMENEIEPVVRDNQGTVGRISNIMDREPIFWETMTSPLVLDPLESLLGPNIEVIKNGHNHATLRRATDSGVGKLHRDMDHWSRTILTVLFYLEESTVENGCTQVIPGTHVFPDAAIPDGSWERFERQVVPVPMPVGGMLAINSTIIHGVGSNRSGGSRMNLTVGYRSVDKLASVEEPYLRLGRGERKYGGHRY